MSASGWPHRADRPYRGDTDRYRCHGQGGGPGFVDVHTHFDAQVFWDDALPVPCTAYHCVRRNWRFTIAPLSDDPSDAEYCSHVGPRHGMPSRRCVGCAWNWRRRRSISTASTGTSVSTSVFGRPLGIRRVVMGHESTSRVDRRRTRADESTAARRPRPPARSGSRRRTPARTTIRRHMFPRVTRHAVGVELARVVRRIEGTSIEVIPQVGPKFDQWAVDLMTACRSPRTRGSN